MAIQELGGIVILLPTHTHTHTHTHNHIMSSLIHFSAKKTISDFKVGFLSLTPHDQITPHYSYIHVCSELQNYISLG